LKKRKKEIRLKIGPPFMDEEVSCEVPGCNQHNKGENFLASARMAIHDMRKREGFRLIN